MDPQYWLPAVLRIWGCWSRILIFSQTLTQHQQPKIRGEKILCHRDLFVTKNFTKLKIILFLNRYIKQFLLKKAYNSYRSISATIHLQLSFFLEPAFYESCQSTFTEKSVLCSSQARLKLCMALPVPVSMPSPSMPSMRLWHWQPDALTTWLDLIQDLARSHPQLG